jgi:hypothetical protein
MVHASYPKSYPLKSEVTTITWSTVARAVRRFTRGAKEARSTAGFFASALNQSSSYKVSAASNSAMLSSDHSSFMPGTFGLIRAVPHSHADRARRRTHAAAHPVTRACPPDGYACRDDAVPRVSRRTRAEQGMSRNGRPGSWNIRQLVGLGASAGDSATVRNRRSELG